MNSIFSQSNYQTSQPSSNASIETLLNKSIEEIPKDLDKALYLANKALKKVETLGETIVFEKSPRNLTTFFFLGNAGHGKSTLSTQMNRMLAEREGLYFKKEWINKSSFSASGVTREVSESNIGDFKTVDTPGFNDADNELNRNKAWSKITSYLNAD